MESKKILTIIVPVYNNEGLVLRALNSIILSDKIEIVIIDDNSTDNSVQVIKKWISENKGFSIKLIQNTKNLGPGPTVNKGYNNMDNDPEAYVLTLCDDDYLLLPVEKLLKEIDGSDIIYFDMINNKGKIYKGNTVPGSSKIYKKSIIGKTRRSKKRFGGDKEFYHKIMDKNPTIKNTNLLFYYYDYPRKNSLMDVWHSTTADITIFTIAFNGYGKFLPKWIQYIKKQTLPPREIIVVLGKNHNAPIDKLSDVTIIYSDSDNMGMLRNLAVEKIKTKWMFYFSADDELLLNAVKDIMYYSKICDVIALKYKDDKYGEITVKDSAIMDNNSIKYWSRTKVPGYIAVKRIINNEVMYYEPIEIPNYPYLFKLASKNAKFKITDSPCAVYKRRKDSHGGSSAVNKKCGQYTNMINEYAKKYIINTNVGVKNKDKDIMDITVFTIVYNNYGGFLDNWISNILKQTMLPKSIIIVLGKNHDVNLTLLKKYDKIKIVEFDSDIMGVLRNQAVKSIKTEWMLYFSVDDNLHDNAIKEIYSQSLKYDVVGLRFIRQSKSGGKIERNSAIINHEDILRWKKYNIPGYFALKRKHKNKILYYENSDIPNLPHLFMLATLNLKIGLTNSICATYIKREDSHGDKALKRFYINDYYKEVDKRAEHYYFSCLKEEKTDKTLTIKVKKTFRDGNVIDKETGVGVLRKKNKTIIDVPYKRAKELEARGYAVII